MRCSHAYAPGSTVTPGPFDRCEKDENHQGEHRSARHIWNKAGGGFLLRCTHTRSFESKNPFGALQVKQCTEYAGHPNLHMYFTEPTEPAIITEETPVPDNTHQALNLYPDQMETILKYIRALDAVDKVTEGDASTTGTHILLAAKIPVMVEGGDELLGYLVDEIGGAWSFQAATYGEMSAHRDAEQAKEEAKKGKGK